MPSSTCRSCGRELPPEVSLPDPQACAPCPGCGSNQRAFRVDVPTGGVSVAGHPGVPSVTANLVADWREDGNRGVVPAVGSATGSATAAAHSEPSPRGTEFPDVLLASEILALGGQTDDGQLVVGVSVPWLEIIRRLDTDPAFLNNVHWRQLEEIVAGAFKRDGWPEVILTPRAADRGRDVIATRPGVGSVRIIGQVKAYRSGHVVDAEEVSAMLGTLQLDGASKAIITTTSTFAPGVYRDARLRPYIPYRVELINGTQLRAWLLTLQRTPRNDNST